MEGNDEDNGLKRRVSRRLGLHVSFFLLSLFFLFT